MKLKIILIAFLILIINKLHSQDLEQKIDTLILKNNESYIRIYKSLHVAPELSGREINTASFLKFDIEKYGYSIVDSLGFQSFAAVLKNGEGPVLYYRTELDALPIKEMTAFEFSSKVKSRSLTSTDSVYAMHACGHDLHMTVWLALAKLFSETRNKWSGTLVFLAQSAEETGQGAKAVINSKNFRKLPKANSFFAIHNSSDLKSGQIGLCNGYALASVDMLNIDIYGKGGHGAMPDKTIDPIVLSAEFINAMQTIVSRNIPPTKSAVITVGAINGGSAGNIIPNVVNLKLTIRTFEPEIREYILKRIKQIGNSLAISAGLDSSLLPKYTLLDMSVPSLKNDENIGNAIEQLMRKKNIYNQVVKVDQTMIGEDFGLYAKSVQNTNSYLIWMGTANALNQKSSPLHSSEFLPDFETEIPFSIKTIYSILYSFLKPKP